MENSNFYSHMRKYMDRKPKGRINFCLRIDKQLYNRLKEISEATNTSIADLIKQKIIELVALYDSGLRNGPGGIRTLDLRLVKATS